MPSSCTTARTAPCSRSSARNLVLSQWLCAFPVFADTLAYRRYHLSHHAHTQQDDDPDLALSAPFPITKASYRRKFWRDITGQTGFQQRKAQFLNALGDPSWPPVQRWNHFRQKLGPQVVANVALFAALSCAGVWWAYPLLWLVPLLTWMMVITRIRNIAEHAVVSDADDPLRNTRTTRANLVARAFIAPYFVNFHLEHHLLMYVPCYNLPRLHALLMQKPQAARMEVQSGYLDVLRLATALSDAEDRPGAIVSNARRIRDGARIGEDQGVRRVSSPSRPYSLCAKNAPTTAPDRYFSLQSETWPAAENEPDRRFALPSVPLEASASGAHAISGRL